MRTRRTAAALTALLCAIGVIATRPIQASAVTPQRWRVDRFAGPLNSHGLAPLFLRGLGWRTANSLYIRNRAVGNANGSSMTSSAMNTATGSLLVLCAAHWTGTNKFGSGASVVSDNNSQSWAVAVTQFGPGGGGDSVGACWYAKNITGKTGHTITVTPTSSAEMSMVIYEVANADTSAPFDTSHTSSSSTTSRSSGNITTYSGGEAFVTGFTPTFWGGEGAPAITDQLWSAFGLSKGIDGYGSGARVVQPSTTLSFDCTTGSPGGSQIILIASFKSAATVGGEVSFPFSN